MATGSDPIADLLALRRDVDRVMERFGAQQERRADDDGERRMWMPAVDVYKQGDDMVVKADVPGVSPSDINVSVTGNMLTIRGERRRQQQTQEGDYVLRESRYGSFERRVTLPQDIDASQVHAQYRAGVLEVTVPRAALVGPQARTVAVGGTQPAAGPAPQQEQPSQAYGQPPQTGQHADYGQAQTETQPYGAGYEGGAQQQEQQEPPRVGVEGGWIRREGETTSSAEEEKPRSTLGSWLHGGRE